MNLKSLYIANGTLNHSVFDHSPHPIALKLIILFPNKHKHGLFYRKKHPAVALEALATF